MNSVINLLIGALFLFSAAHSVQTPRDGRFRAETGALSAAYLPEIAHSSHAANLLQLRNGDVLCFWFTGEWEGDSGVGIAFSRLVKGSRQWTEPRLIDSEPGVSFQNPVAFEAPDGTLWLFHTTQQANKGEAGARVLVVKSHDDGRTWSSPEMLFDAPGSFTRGPLVVRPDGAWLLPMYVSAGSGHASEDHSLIKLSRDQGRSWSDCPVPDSNGYIQPDVLELAPHRYVALFRSRFADHIFRSTSSDGCHWTAPVATSLPNNDSSIQAVVLHDGKIALAFNNTHGEMKNGKRIGGARVPLTVALSSDGGVSWTHLHNIEVGRCLAADDPAVHEPLPKTTDREAYSYPSILETGTGEIMIAYTWRRETIKVVEFPEAWLEQASDGLDCRVPR